MAKKKTKRKYPLKKSHKLKKYSRKRRIINKKSPKLNKKYLRKKRIFNTKTKKKINLRKYIKRQKGGMMQSFQETLLSPRRGSVQEPTRTYYLDKCTQLIKEIYDKLVERKFDNNELLKDLKSENITEDIIRKLLNIIIPMNDGNPASSVIEPDEERRSHRWYERRGTEYKNMLMISLPDVNRDKIVELGGRLGQMILEKEAVEEQAAVESKERELANIRREMAGLWEEWDSAFHDSYDNIEQQLILVLSVVVNAMNEEEKYLRNPDDFDLWYNALDPSP